MKKILFLLMAVILVVGCSVSQKNLYTLSSDYLERRNVETRMFETQDEASLLTACAQVLQDLGYSIKESNVKLGMLTADKNRDVNSKTGKAALTTMSLISAFSGKGDIIYEDTQKFYVNIVTTPTKEKTIKVRVLFTRRSWDNYGNIYSIEKITDKKTYQEFFDKLSQSIFLTANGI